MELEIIEQIRKGLEQATNLVTFVKSEGDMSEWIVTSEEIRIRVYYKDGELSTERVEPTKPEEVEEEKAKEVKEVSKESQIEKFEKWLDENGYNWDGYGFGDDAEYIIEGFTYTVNCYYEDLGKRWVLYTTHKGRLEKESDIMNTYGDTSKAEGNQATRKKLASVFKYIEKWTDK